MAKTIRERYTAKLLELGAVQVKSGSSKYHVFKYEYNVGGEIAFTRFIFLGKAGAIRANDRSAVDGSVSEPRWLMALLETVPGLI